MMAGKPTTFVTKRSRGPLEGRSGHFREMSDGSIWFDADPVQVMPRSVEHAMRLAAEDAATTGEFDQIDWDSGGDGWVYK
jgi:hypothetical protein